MQLGDALRGHRGPVRERVVGGGIEEDVTGDVALAGRHHAEAAQGAGEGVPGRVNLRQVMVLPTRQA
jgi:hypothetical protein